MKNAKFTFKSFGRPVIEIGGDEPIKAKKLFDKMFKDKME